MAASMGSRGHAASRPPGLAAATCLSSSNDVSSSVPLPGPCPGSLLPCLYTEPCVMKKRDCLLIIAQSLLLLSEIRGDLNRDRHGDEHYC